MAQLKVKKKDIIVINTIIFLGLSFLFLCLQHAYRHQLSAFSLTFLKKSLQLFWPLALMNGIAAVMIWRHHKWARYAFMVGLGLVGFKVIEGLFIEFNKIIVIALFFYVVISNFLYQLLSYYLSLASVNANYEASDLFAPMLRIISGKIKMGDQIIDGHLTNWDDEGCFFKCTAPMTFTGKIEVIISFQGREFIQSGEVVARSLDFSGFGIKFSKTAKDLRVFNWSEFMELVDELGFQPQRLR